MPLFIVQLLVPFGTKSLATLSPKVSCHLSNMCDIVKCQQFAENTLTFTGNLTQSVSMGYIQS